MPAYPNPSGGGEAAHIRGEQFERSFETNIRPCDPNHKLPGTIGFSSSSPPTDRPAPGPSRVGLIRRLPLHKKDSLHLIAIQVLVAAANLNDNFHPRQRHYVAAQDAAIPHLDCVVSRRAKFKADAAARGVVRADLERKLALVEAFLGEFEHMFADCSLHDFRSGSNFGAVQFGN